MTGLFKKPEMPKVEPPTPMPDEKELTVARRRRVAKETSGGAGQTILSAGGRETLGG